jgi:hypothetical protein
VSGLPTLGSAVPAELAFVPANARMVAYADVRQLMNSPLHDHVRQFESKARINPDGLEARTGIDIESDVDRVLVASMPAAAGTPLQRDSLLLARGRFDLTRIEGLMREQGAQVSDYRGVRIVSLKDDARDAAMAFAEPGLIAFGPAHLVRAGLDAKAGAADGIRADAGFMKLVADVDDGAAWSVAKMDSLPGAGLPPAVVSQLPPIDWIAASGQVDTGIHGFVRADARDAQGAKDLHDVVQGFLALLKLQGARQPQYKGLLDSVALSAQGNSVSLTFDITPAMLDRLAPPRF